LTKKILIAIPRYKIGGAETQALYLAVELQKRGYQVLVGAFGFEIGEGYSRFMHSGLECIHWGFQEKIILEPQRGVIGSIRKYRYIFKLLLRIRFMEIDCIIPFTYPVNLIFCDWYRWMNVKKCFWNQRDEGRLFVGNQKEIQAFNKASTIISNSLEGVRFLRKFSNREIIHIPNGIDPSFFTPLNGPKNSKKVVMIGNIHGYKDHLTLIRSWKLVLDRFPDFKLVLLGEKGIKFEGCHSLVKELGIENSVEFKGQIKDVPAVLRQSCLAVFSSENEGLPNGVLEPMAAGLAVVASNIQGTREALGSDYEFLVDFQNPKLFADKIMLLLGDDLLRIKVGHENLERVSLSFPIKSMVDRYESLING
jgi:glycosyltransferase involved in cell wall biosynthesis